MSVSKKTEARLGTAKKGAPRAPDGKGRVRGHFDGSVDEAMGAAAFVTGRIRRRPGRIELRSCKPSEEMKVVALSGLVILETHWLFGRTVPHFRPPAKCACNFGLTSTRIKGYFLAMAREGGKAFLVEVTELAILGWNPEPDCQAIRFCEVTLRRRGLKPNGRLTMTVGKEITNRASWKVPEIDVRRAILEIMLQDRPAFEEVNEAEQQAPTEEGKNP